MKKILIMAAALLTLCSCSLLDDELLMQDPENTADESEDTEPAKPELSADDILKEYGDLFSGGDSSIFSPDDFSSYVPDTPADVPDSSPTAEQPASDAPADTPAAPPAAQSAVPAPPPTQLPANCLSVPYISQNDYPSGCELVSSAMLLRYYGFETEPSDLINGGFITYQLLDRDGNDELFGGDPNKIFIGDPFSRDGYGCYSRTIFSGLEKYLENKYFDTVYLTGTPLSYICDMYIDFGQPVLIWATSGMEPTDKKTPVAWKISETGESFTWIPNEHCMVLVGYDDEYYYFNDPLTGQAVPYEKAVTDERYRELGSQSVTIHPW